MRKNFITNIGFLLLLNLLVKPFWILGIDRSVQNEIGPLEYGIYFSLFNFAYLFQVVLDFGINNYNNRLVAQRPERLGAYLFSTLVVKLLLSAVYLIILFVVAFGVHFSPEQLHLLWLLGLMQIGMSFYSFLRSNVNALHLFKTDAVLSVLDKLLTSAICGILLWTNLVPVAISAEVFIYTQLLGYAISLVVATVIIARVPMPFTWKVDLQLVREIFLKSYPYALLGFLMTAYYRIDGVLIERMLGENGAYEAGLYAAAFRILDALGILGFLFAGLLMPMFSRMLEEKLSIEPLLDMGYRLMLLFSAAAGIAFIFHRNELMSLLYDTGNAYTGSIFGWLMVSFICISITYVFGSLLTAGGKIGLLNRISLAGFGVNFILNLVLIPRYHALGAAVATVASQSLVLAAHIVMAYKQFHLSNEVKRWVGSFIFIFLVLIINFCCTLLPIDWLLQLGLSGLLSLLAVMPSGLIKRDEIKSFVNLVSSSLRKKGTVG